MNRSRSRGIFFLFPLFSHTHFLCSRTNLASSLSWEEENVKVLSLLFKPTGSCYELTAHTPIRARHQDSLLGLLAAAGPILQHAIPKRIAVYRSGSCLSSRLPTSKKLIDKTLLTFFAKYYVPGAALISRGRPLGSSASHASHLTASEPSL